MEGLAIKSAYQVNNITTTIAAGKTMVEIFAEADHKSIGIIPLMNRTRAKELITLFSKLIQQAFVFQHGGNGHQPLQPAKT